MPTLALIGYAVFLALAFGLRTFVHYRQTGTSGFVGLAGRGSSAEWLGGVLSVLALVGGLAAPALQLAGWVEPWRALVGEPIQVAGVLCFVAGLAATLWAQLAMGVSWRIGVDPAARTALVATGPFRWVRNPIFSSMTMASLGLFLLAPNLVSLLALLSLIVALEIQVRLVEEPYLVRTQGRAYVEYGLRSGRFIPGVGRLAARYGERGAMTQGGVAP